MTGKKSKGRLRGGFLPARLRIASRRGTTLVELMISMLILAIVCIGWLEIIGIQSARKESRRREAVERLAGMMDAFIYEKLGGGVSTSTAYHMTINGTKLSFEKDDSGTNVVHAMFADGVSPIGYQLCIVAEGDLPDKDLFYNWGGKRWLVGRLYNGNGNLGNVGRPFFTLPVCLGF